MINKPLGKIDCFGISRKLPQFKNNTDRFVIADLRPSLRIHHSTETPKKESSQRFGESLGQLLAVADGVGDRKSAFRGSALAVETVNAHLLNSVSVPSLDDEFDDPQLFDEFNNAIEECREAMQREVDAADRFNAMGAVLTLAYVAWPSAYFMHVGNGRAYHCRKEAVEQITTDHTLARRLVDALQLSQKEARRSDLRNVVWNLIGTQTEDTSPEFIARDLEIGDAIILCSDGLTAAIGAREITKALKQADTAERRS